MVEGAGRRPFLGPGLERREVGESRQVVTAARRHHLLGSRLLAEEDHQALRRRLILAEVPGPPEERQERPEPAGRTGREAVRPALLGHLRRVTLGDGPGAGRVHDQRTLARDQPLVVRGIVPRRCIVRQERHQALVVVQRLAHVVALDGDVALGVHELRTEAVEDRAGGIDAVRRVAEADAEGGARLVAGLCRLHEGIESPVFGFRRSAGGVHRLDVDAGMLLQHVDARAGALDLAADRRRHGEPLAAHLAEILDGSVNGAVLFDQRLHDVVHRHQLVGVACREPGREGQHVVAGFGLGFRGGRQQELVALRSDVIDRDVDLLLGRPFLDQCFAGLVGARNPMVPQAERELACSIGTADERRCHHRGGQSSRTGHETTTTDFPGSHEKFPPMCRPDRAADP